MSWRRQSHASPHLLVYRGIPIRTDDRQGARAYLHIVGMPRTQVSHDIRVFLGVVDSGAEPTKPIARHGFYNSPTPQATAEHPARPGALHAQAQEPATLLINLSTHADALSVRSTVDLSFCFDGPSGPLDASEFIFTDIFITLKP